MDQDGTIKRKRFYLSTGYDDTPANRHRCGETIRRIQRDLDYGEVDLTLKKYKTAYSLSVVGEYPEGAKELEAKVSVPLARIWAEYVSFKVAQGKSPTTIAKDYQKTERLIAKLPASDIEDAVKIRDWLVRNCTPNAAKRYMTQINAACEWAVVSGLVKDNPFRLLKQTIRIPRSQRKTDDSYIKAFTAEERDRILAAFNRHPHYKRYYPYVWFLFFSGCRPSEAIALTWGNISETHITFDSAWVEGVDGYELKKGLKTQDKRSFPMNETMRDFLHKHRPPAAKPSDLVFTSPRGGHIDSHNFANRAWKSILSALEGIPKFPPYHTRHTFITLCLDAGIHEKDVKRWCGNSAAIILAAYASAKRDLVVPQL
ncbi:MAG: site-specific integrase [Thermostichales cyanobacterium BF4_bins_65]